MPKLPKWMADAMQSLFSGMYHPVKVTEIKDIASRLRKVRFEGDFSKLKKEFVPGNVIEFRINDTEFRHYTPSYFNRKENICEVVFFLHDKGPGSKWVAQLNIGDELNLLGPGGKIKYNPAFNTHIVFGDETSLGAFLCFKKETEKQGTDFLGIAELDKENKHWGDLLALDIFAVSKTENEKGAEAILKLEALLKQHQNSSKTAFYLTGNAKSILRVKQFLLGKGYTSKQIQTEPYWVEGKYGL